MGQLDHHRAAMFVAGVGQVGDPRHDLVLISQHVVEHRRAVLGYGRRSGCHRQCHTGLCAFGVIGPVAGFGHAVFGIGGFMTGGPDPVSQGQMLELEGLQQRIGRHGAPLWQRQGYLTVHPKWRAINSIRGALAVLYVWLCRRKCACVCSGLGGVLPPKRIRCQ